MSLARENVVLQQKYSNTIASTPLLYRDHRAHKMLDLPDVIKRGRRGKVIVDVLMTRGGGDNYCKMHAFSKYTSQQLEA